MTTLTTIRSLVRSMCVMLATGLIIDPPLGCVQPASPVDGVPVLHDATVQPNTHNVLSAAVIVRASGASVVRLEASTNGTFVARTPDIAVMPDSTVVPLLLLRPSTSYSVRVILTGGGHTQMSGGMSFTTGPLPEELPPLRLLSSSDPSPGYVLTGITSSEPSPRCYALILNNEAEVVWYRGFDVPVTDFQKLPAGGFSVYASPDNAPPRFLQLDPLGNVVSEYAALAPAATGPHELRVSDDMHYLFGVEFRPRDLTPLGGQAEASVRGISVEGFRAGARFFYWSTFDHVAVDDASSDISVTGSVVNPWHGNAIETDGPDHLLVSFRNMDEITKLDIGTGQIVWRLGGKQNEFTFIGDPLDGFSHQHGVRRLSNGNIILFDNGNGHTPQTSRAVEYRLDESARTATLVWEYRASSELYSSALGFAHRLDDGRTLICFGISQRLREVDASGNTTWDVSLDKPSYYPYRAFRVSSVY